MRQWLVDPMMLCDRHLLGEHVEHHMFVGSINKGISCLAYITKGLLNPALLQIRHTHLAEEMKRRGMNHNSLLPPLDAEKLEALLKIEPTLNVRANYEELIRRCPDCRKRILNEK